MGGKNGWLALSSQAWSKRIETAVKEKRPIVAEHHKKYDRLPFDLEKLKKKALRLSGGGLNVRVLVFETGGPGFDSRRKPKSFDEIGSTKLFFEGRLPESQPNWNFLLLKKSS